MIVTISSGSFHVRRLAAGLAALALLGFSSASHALFVSFDSTGMSVQEGAGTAVVNLVVSGCDLPAASPNNILQATVASSGGSATAGSDYVGPPITVDFVVGADGQWVTSAAVPIGIVDDPDIEGDETAALSITNLSGQVLCDSPQGVSSPELGSIPTTTITIVDNDSVGPAATPIVQPSVLQLEGGAGESPTASFTIVEGTGPFEISVGNTDRGQVDNPTPALGETVTYSFRIPGAATDRQTFNDSLTIVGADGGTITVEAIITAVVSGGTISQEDIDEAMQNIAATQPQSATAAVISNVCPQGIAEPRFQEDCNVMVGGALDPDEETNLESGQALAQVTSDQASAPVDAAQSGLQVQGRNVGTRLTALRLGARGLTSALNINVNGQSLPASALADGLWNELLTANGGSAGSDAGMNLGRLGVFVNGSVSLGNRDGSDNVAGFDFDTTGITLGADYRFTDQLVMGLAAGYLKTDTSLDAKGGDLNTDGYSLSLYGTYYRDSGMYLDGILSYGNNDFDQTRNIRYDIGATSVRQQAKSKFDGNQFSAALGGGYSMSRDALSFGPTLRFEYVDVDVDGYNERMSNPDADGGGWASHINGQKMKSFTSQLGGEISYAMSQNWGVLLPQAQFEWVHEFKDGGDQVTGFFLQDPSRTGFALNTDSLDNNYFNLRLGVSAQISRGRSGYFYYRKLLGYRDVDIDSFSAGIRLEF